MENRPKLSDEPAWKKLQDAFSRNGAKLNIFSLLKDEPKRFDNFSLKVQTPKDGDILLDYSKNRINDEVFNLLLELKLTKDLPEVEPMVISIERDSEISEDSNYSGEDNCDVLK